MADIKSAMKNKEADKLTTLRFLSSAIKNKEIEMRPKEISDVDVLSVIKKLVKQRKDSIQQFKDAQRDDLVAKETSELGVLQTYLPEPMSEEQVIALVEEVMASVGAQSIKDMGRVMGEVNQRTQGNADNRMVSEIVKTKLQS